VRHDDELRPLARPGSDLLAHRLDRHAVLGEGRGDLREHTRAVGDVEADVVARERLPHVDHRQVGVGGLARPAATGHPVAGDGDDVTEDGAGRRVAPGAAAVEHERPGSVASTKTALKASRTLASGWLRGIIAGWTRTLTASEPSALVTRSQIASSLTTQSISLAAWMSPAVTSVMPSRCTSRAGDPGVEGQAGEDGGLGGGVEALDVGGRVGLGIAQGLGLLDGLGEARAGGVHLVQDEVRRAVDDADDLAHVVTGEGLTHAGAGSGWPRPRRPRSRGRRPASAAAYRAGPSSASSALLAVTTEAPCSMARRMSPRAGSMPPITSTTMSARVTSSSASAVNSAGSTGTSGRGRRAAARRCRRARAGAPTRAARSSACSTSRVATAEPTTPQPSSATRRGARPGASVGAPVACAIVSCAMVGSISSLSILTRPRRGRAGPRWSHAARARVTARPRTATTGGLGVWLYWLDRARQ
jgi:hypothetical protein